MSTATDTQCHHLQLWPGELYLHLLVFLPDRELFHLTLVCRRALQFLSQQHRLWQACYLRRFNVQDTRERRWLGWCLGGKHHRATSTDAVPVCWFKVYCARMMVKFNLLRNRHRRHHFTVDGRQLARTATARKDPPSHQPYRLLLLHTARRSAWTWCWQSPISSQLAMLPLKVPPAWANPNLEFASTDQHLVFYQRKRSHAYIHAVRRHSAHELTMNLRPPAHHGRSDHSRGSGRDDPTSRFSIYTVRTTGPWLLTCGHTSTIKRRAIARIYHIEHRRWCTGYMTVAHEDLQSVAPLHAPNQLVNYIQCHATRTADSEGTVTVKAQLWQQSLYDPMPRCLSTTDLPVFDQPHDTPRYYNTRTYRVDDRRVLIYVSYGSIGRLLCYKPPQLDEQYKRIALQQHPVRNLGVQWQIDTSLSQVYEVPTIVGPWLIMVDIQQRLCKYALATGELVSCVSCVDTMIKPLLGGIYTVREKQSGTLSIMDAVNRPMERLHAVEGTFGYVSTWTHLAWQRHRELIISDFCCTPA